MGGVGGIPQLMHQKLRVHGKSVFCILQCTVRPISGALCPAKSLQSCPTLCNPMDCSLLKLREEREHTFQQGPFHFRKGQSMNRLLCPWDSPGKNNVVNCHSLLQGISLTPGIGPASLTLKLHWQAGSLPLAPPGKPPLGPH